MRMLLSEPDGDDNINISTARSILPAVTNNTIPLPADANDTPKLSDVRTAVAQLQGQINSLTGQTPASFPCPEEPNKH